VTVSREGAVRHGRASVLLVGFRSLLGIVAVAALVGLLGSGGAEATVAHLTTGCDPFYVNPVWSPDGSKIVFATDRADGDLALWLMNADGSGATKIVSYKAQDLQPQAIVSPDLQSTWSPDGSRIAFSRWVTGNDGASWRTHLVNADGSGLTNSGVRGIEPAWSPRGDKIAFHTERDGNAEIYAMNADGTEQKNLTNNPALDVQPAWSPDGSKIAFVRHDGGLVVWDIFVMNADGSGVTQLTHTREAGKEELHPTWSPDGSKIAFEAGLRLFVMNADGSDVRQSPLPTGLFEDAPSWSRSGRIIFTGGSNSCGASTDIYTVNPDGSDLRNITRTYGSQRDGAIVIQSRQTVPDPPRAGKKLTAILKVANYETTTPIAQGTTVCRASAGRRALQLVTREFAHSRARCVWRLPLHAKRKTVSGTIGLLSGNFSVNWRFTRYVR
jgi:Tol biopolymer transport system component